jgi:hypothetical protein
MYTWVIAAEDLRSLVRFRILKKASVLTSFSRHSVSLHDITSRGACISSIQSLSVGMDVFFDHGDLSLVACVKWCNGSRMGLQFYGELSEKELKSVQLAKPSRFRWLPSDQSR